MFAVLCYTQRNPAALYAYMAHRYFVVAESFAAFISRVRTRIPTSKWIGDIPNYIFCVPPTVNARRSRGFNESEGFGSGCRLITVITNEGTELTGPLTHTRAFFSWNTQRTATKKTNRFVGGATCSLAYPSVCFTTMHRSDQSLRSKSRNAPLKKPAYDLTLKVSSVLWHKAI